MEPRPRALTATTHLVPTTQQQDDSGEETSFDNPEHEPERDESSEIVDPLGADRHGSPDEHEGGEEEGRSRSGEEHVGGDFGE
jgi:hypothetical protein